MENDKKLPELAMLVNEDIEEWNKFDSGVKNLTFDMKYRRYVCFLPGHSCWKEVDGNRGGGECYEKYYKSLAE